MSHVHAHEPAPAPRPSMERLAGELRFRVVGRLEPAAAPKPRAKRAARFPPRHAARDWVAIWGFWQTASEQWPPQTVTL